MQSCASLWQKRFIIHVSEHSNQKVARSFTREGLAGVANFYPVPKLAFPAKNLEVFDQFANRVFGEHHFLCSPDDARRL